MIPSMSSSFTVAGREPFAQRSLEFPHERGLHACHCTTPLSIVLYFSRRARPARIHVALPGGETVSQQVLVLFFQVRILAG